ncbi:MAG: serine/threonine protein kinase [Gemmataceae bacterium]
MSEPTLPFDAPKEPADARTPFPSDQTVRPTSPSTAPDSTCSEPLRHHDDGNHTTDRDDLESLTAVQRLEIVVESRVTRGDPVAAGYRIIRKLGEGTYGAVWLAEDQLGVKVAIKFFAHGTGQQWQFLQDEVKSLATLDSTFGIVQLKEVEPDTDPPYFVMSYAEGGSLASKLKAGALPLREAYSYFRQVAEALAFVHAKGIRHCDLKPANILLNQHSQPLIADFGQAHLSDDAVPALGTFFYMAPEQADDSPQIPDTRWDVYGLGALFYAMLTGGPPRKDSDLNERLKSLPRLHHRLKTYREGIVAVLPPTDHRKVAGMDRMLAEIVDKCLTLDPAQRYRDAGAILTALETRRRLRRQRPFLIFGAIASLGVLLMTAGAGTMVARSAVRDAKTVLQDELLSSNTVTARLTAKILEEKLGDGIAMLRDFTCAETEPELPGMVAEISRRRRENAALRLPVPPALTLQDLQPLRSWIERKYKTPRCSLYFRGLAVVDADGYMLTRYDKDRGLPDDDTQWSLLFEQRYCWRDWFNGRGDQHSRRDVALPPVSRPHISQPYMGERINRGKKLVNISVPLSKVDGKPVGLLVGHIDWREVQGWLDQLRDWMKDVKVAGGFPVVVNGRGHCLTHADVEKIEPAMGQNPIEYYPVELVGSLSAGSNALWSDPVRGGQIHLAGYAPARPAGADEQWLVLIEHDPQAALKTVGDLQVRLRYIGWATLGIMTVLVGGLWGWLVWTLRREERMAHG